jgi:hypothetical protein
MQAYFGFRLCRNLFPDRPAFVWCGGIILLLAPAMTWRAFGHFEIGAHWLILASLTYYSEDPSKKGVRGYLLPLYVLAFLTGSIDPYLEFLVMLTCQAAVLRLLLRHEVTLFKAVAVSTGPVAAGVIALVIFGFFALKAGYAGGGYRYLS